MIEPTSYQRYLDTEEPITLLLAGVVKVICPPGIAVGAFDFRNRGMLLQAEVTVWPKLSRHHYRLTTATELGGPQEISSRGLFAQELYVYKLERRTAIERELVLLALENWQYSVLEFSGELTPEQADVRAMQRKWGVCPSDLRPKPREFGTKAYKLRSRRLRKPLACADCSEAIVKGEKYYAFAIQYTKDGVKVNQCKGLHLKCHAARVLAGTAPALPEPELPSVVAEGSAHKATTDSSVPAKRHVGSGEAGAASMPTDGQG